MIHKIFSVAHQGLEGRLVEIEAGMSYEMPGFVIVGLPDAAVQEAKERVKHAILNSGFEFPKRKLTVNLAPADIRKEGPAFDLALALAILLCNKQINVSVDKALFIGELALDGSLRATRGVLPAAIFAKKQQFKTIFVPPANQHEAALVSGLEVIPVSNLAETIDHLEGRKIIPAAAKTEYDWQNQPYESDMKYVKGQEQAKRALEIAAAGAHNIIMSGPPGSGKTLLARTLPTILPELTEEEILEVTKIYSIAGLLSRDQPVIKTRPFRSPHLSSSGVALVGGGANPKPGEISLAHRGLLFLDELPEFPRMVLEHLRQPLEDGVISISRAQGTYQYPARFILVASQNPCPCGYASDPERECTCTMNQKIQYQKKISGPLLDRIDLHLEVPRVPIDKIQNDEEAESSSDIRKRVAAAHEIQNKRFAKLSIRYNSEMRPQDLNEFCRLNIDARNLLKQAAEKLRLTTRSYYRIIKLARTIADLEQNSEIETKHIAEALQYRPS